ncbi:hypothetical protein SS50377_26859 [Spironucleus salmonicida]|uniref:Uncharacterized protein n=1 Tax=Spironucleus salmonicida TaxID=348837 RepID=V6LXG9_9EUKA|nr:hypothetical protein SS50377_26859 [Spironucleus salmonicida]|eukprot:EST49327.1 Hypothetical protein SS50377_10553 [Spironucleus salmonicida]
MTDNRKFQVYIYYQLFNTDTVRIDTPIPKELVEYLVHNINQDSKIINNLTILPRAFPKASDVVYFSPLFEVVKQELRLQNCQLSVKINDVLSCFKGTKLSLYGCLIGDKQVADIVQFLRAGRCRILDLRKNSFNRESKELIIQESRKVKAEVIWD